VIPLTGIGSRSLCGAGYTNRTEPAGVSAVPGVHVAVAALIMVAGLWLVVEARHGRRPVTVDANRQPDVVIG
jgi:hypothetical protein